MDAKSVLNVVISTSGMNKTELAHAIGKSVNYISNYSVRGNIPRLDTFATIADVSGYEVVVRKRDNATEIIIDPPKEDTHA